MMRPIERSINFAQVLASLCLGAAYLLPFYETQGLLGGVKHADNPLLFFCAIPISVMIYKLTSRWLKVGICALASLGGLIALLLIRFLAYFKAAPLTGFFVAQTSIGILIVCWLSLIVIMLLPARIHTEQTSANKPSAGAKTNDANL